jgi:hypothetical protein
VLSTVMWSSTIPLEPGGPPAAPLP